MKALISPNESAHTGYRVAEVHQTGFDVAPPLFWVDCSDNITQDRFWYDPADQTIKEFPPPPEPEAAEDQPESEGTQDI